MTRKLKQKGVIDVMVQKPYLHVRTVINGHTQLGHAGTDSRWFIVRAAHMFMLEAYNQRFIFSPTKC